MNYGTPRKQNGKYGNGKYFKQYGDFTAMPGKRPIIRLSKQLCDHPQQIAATLYHEMVHFWLYTNKRPWGHTKEFKEKLKTFNKYLIINLPCQETIFLP